MSLLSFDEALAQLLAAARRVKGSDRVALDAADGRVLAEPVVSGVDVPPADNSAMDGYAVRCADVTVAGTRLAVSQRIAAGSVGAPLTAGSAARIFTGAPLPPGADAVVMQEDCTADDAGVVVNQPPQPGQHIRRAGEDLREGATILEAGLRLTPQAIGLAAAAGQAQLAVYRPLSVALLATGSELVDPGTPLPPGAIYNSNRPLLKALLVRMGCAVEDMGSIPDTLEATRKALRRAGALHDLVITTGGVSVGEEDHVKPAVEAEGELNLWKIAIKPGKPLACGRVGNADFIGLPGNPVSVFVTFALLVRPFIQKCQGAQVSTPRVLRLPAAFDWPRPDRRREFLRARRNADGAVELYANQSSGVLSSTVWADGFVDVSPGQAIRRGDTVDFMAFTEFA
jgi:molybdopterin molybdotransferase